jgi:hypothetical protein
MQYLGLLFTLTTLLVNLWGLSLIMGLFWRNRWMALAVGPWIGATLMFAFESINGLGRLEWLGLLSTLVSVAMIGLSNSTWTFSRWTTRTADRVHAWREEFRFLATWRCLTVFVFIFGYALAWRVSFPDIDGSSEKISDLSYIASYMPGSTIPVVDAWLHPYPSVHYYSFQHYAAALMGRMLGLSAGMTYNYAFCALTALIGVAFGGAVSLLARRRWVKIMLVLAFVFGGSGVSGLVHFFYKDPQLWNTNRFIGTKAYDREPLGVMLQAYDDKYKELDLAGEPFAYSIFLGDYHAPMSGYYLLGIGVMGALLWMRTQRAGYAALVGATLTWSVLANTWSLPLQAIWVVGWCWWSRRRWYEPVLAVALGAAAVWLAAAVYLQAFTLAAGEYKTAWRFVAWDSHAPPVLFVLFMLPTLVLAVLGFYSRNRAMMALGVVSLLYLVMAEFTYIDDVYSGPFDRFNTTLKWWPWITAAVLLVQAPLLIEQAKRRWVRWCAVVACVYPCFFGVEACLYLWNVAKPNPGRMAGEGFLVKDEPTRYVLAKLKLEPWGVVIERHNKDSYSNSACLPLFAGKAMWLGWLGHEMLWRGYPPSIAQREERLLRFFDGTFTPDDTLWRAEQISYILWYQEKDTNELWDKIDLAIRNDYTWCQLFTTAEGRKVGYWKNLRPTPAR